MGTGALGVGLVRVGMWGPTRPQGLWHLPLTPCGNMVILFHFSVPLFSLSVKWGRIFILPCAHPTQTVSWRVAFPRRTVALMGHCTCGQAAKRHGLWRFPLWPHNVPSAYCKCPCNGMVHQGPSECSWFSSFLSVATLHWPFALLTHHAVTSGLCTASGEGLCGQRQPGLGPGRSLAVSWVRACHL